MSARTGQREHERAALSRARSRPRSVRRAARRGASTAPARAPSPRVAPCPRRPAGTPRRSASWSSGAMPGPVVADGNADLAVDAGRGDVDGPARRRELHGVRQQVEDDLPDPALVADDRLDARARTTARPGRLPSSPARARSRPRARAPPGRENGATWSSIWPASTFERSSTSSISDSRCRDGGEDVVEVLGLLVVDLAEQLLAQHLREPADRVQRGPQLVRHVGQEFRLVATGGLELAGLLVQLRQRGRPARGFAPRPAARAPRRTPPAGRPSG